MLVVSSVDLYPGSQEERLPGFTPQFPHLVSCSILDRYPQHTVPWHWHRSVELFYIKSGALIYYTPGGQRLFRAGSGGLVNSNVLHRTRAVETGAESIQYVHLFEPELVTGVSGGVIEQRYVAPLLKARGLELIGLSPEDPVQAETLALLRESYALDETDFGYELELQAVLCRIWAGLARQVQAQLGQTPPAVETASEKIKPMMLYIHAHLAEKLSVEQLAAAVFCSEREYYRTFRACLHTTPGEYIRNVRLQTACKLLRETELAVTEVARRCGLGSSSYFGAQFRQEFGCTPTEYRLKWQNSDIGWQENDSGTPAACGTIMA